MKTVKSLQALIAARQDLPKVGWIFVDKKFDKTSVDMLIGATFHIQEDDEDEFYGEENFDTWLEAPTFLDVLELREKHLNNPTAEDYALACTHYLEMDDFLE
ncbi:MAG: hypothetical protein FWG14_11450 [Peptococcaceae bacterium]|nr:hypothetical protein [Peptococcaceae bacterium]